MFFLCTISVLIIGVIMFSNRKKNPAETIIKCLEEDAPSQTDAIFQFIPLTDTEVERLANALKSNTHVRYLNLFDCGLTDKQLALLISAIKENCSLCDVAIDRMNSTDPHHQALLADLDKALETLQKVESAETLRL